MTLYTLGASRITTPATTLLIPATLVGTMAAAALVAYGDSPPPM